MAFQIAGLPGVNAFLQSIFRILDAVIEMGNDHFLPVDTELKEMKSLLRGFEYVLLDGEKRRHLGDSGAERWMDDLKDLLYDIDDLLDEIRMEKLQLQPEITGQPSNGRARYNFSDGFFTVKGIKIRLGQVLIRLGKHKNEADCLALKRDAVQHDAIWLSSQAKIRPKSGCYADEPLIHGREEDKNRLIEILLAEDGGQSKSMRKYEVVCVVGMGGLGKTTLAQLVFQDERIKQFFAVSSWACVSDVFDIIKVAQDLIESAERGDSAASMPSGLPALQDRLKKTVNDKKFLLVLDDVWTTKEWKELKGPLNFGAKGSKILVTTRLRKVAEDLGNKEPYRLGRLEDAQCLKIFNDNAFGDEDGNDNDTDFMKMGKEIVRKCEGVPLVAKVIGSLLNGEDEGRWKAVKDNDLWNLAYESEDLHPGLRLSYFYLPPFLKRCFEYLALFPSDFKFERDEIVRMWMAEDLIEVKEGTEPEEIGNQYYNDLKARSLIQEDDMKHDMVHHLACIVSGSSFFRGSIGSTSATSSLKSVRHAYIYEKLPEVLIDGNKLRTLIYKGDSCQQLSSCKRLRVVAADTWTLRCDLKHLRYLKLTSKFLNSTHLDSICTLTNLQVLDLSYCKDLKSLPQDVGKLSHLRLLRLNNSAVAGLPDSICKLTNLQVLDLSYSRYLKNLPQDVGKLLNLRSLQIGNTGILSLPGSICTLTNLEVLDLSNCRDLKNLPQDVGKLSNLRSFKLGNTGIIILPDSICTLVNLQVLELFNCLDLKNLPQDVGKLSNLWSLQLGNTGIISLPDSICTLPTLQVLDLSYSRDLKNLPQDVGKLSNLRLLQLGNSGIISLPDSICTLTNLQVLDLSNCRDLKNLPQDVGQLSNLRSLQLGNTGIISLPDSVCCLSKLRVLHVFLCTSLTTLPKDVGNLQSLDELNVFKSSISSLPNSVSNATNLRVLQISESVTLPMHFGKLTKLKRLSCFRVGMVKGRGIDELKDMNRLQGSLSIENMENIESAEEALMANLRSKHIEDLQFVWNAFDAALTGRDGEAVVRVMESLEPNAAIKSLSFQNYVGHKLPSWMTTAPALHNLTRLCLNNLPAMTQMTGMDFKSLGDLELHHCSALREVSMTTGNLERLVVTKCNELKRRSLVILPLVWDALETLECEYCLLDHFLQQLKSENASPCTKLRRLIVSIGGDNGITSSPVGWPSIFTSLEDLTLEDLPPTNFKIVSEEDERCSVAQSELLVSIRQLTIRNCPGLVSLESLHLPPFLVFLHISNCPNLRNLPYGLRDLTSLNVIHFWNCPILEIRPYHPLPPSHKYIRICPKLEEQRVMEEREEWKGAFGLI